MVAIQGTVVFSHLLFSLFNFSRFSYNFNKSDSKRNIFMLLNQCKLFHSRCPIVEEEDSAVPLTSDDSRVDSANGGGCIVSNIPSKEVSLTSIGCFVVGF